MLPTLAEASTPEADPIIYAQAFEETCRQGFPDVDAIARNAKTLGWTEAVTGMALSGGVTTSRPPRVFMKSGLVLFVNHSVSGPFSTICQVTGSAPSRLTGRDVAAVVTPRLHAGEPTLGTGDYRKDDRAQWTIQPGITVQAGVSVYRGKVRTITMVIRQAATDGAIPAAAPPPRKSDSLPMVALSMRFEPEVPKPVAPTHPLFHDVTIGEIDDLPSTVKSSGLNWVPAAKRSSINAALLETFRGMNMLSSRPTTARKKLLVTWKGDRTPFHIGTGNSTTVTKHYQLTRVQTQS